MLTLLTYPPAFGLFSASPFCVKSALMLQHCGQDWQRSDMLDPRKMPHRKHYRFYERLNGWFRTVTKSAIG